MLESGLYEQVINKELGTAIDNASDKDCSTAPIDSAEASKVLSKYIANIIEKGLDAVVDNGGDINSQVALANKIVNTIIAESGEEEFSAMSVDERAEQLLSVLDKIYTSSSKNSLPRPETSIAQSSLFTGAIHEPQMFTELKKEILSADKIDMLVSFIKWSGLRLIIDELREFTQNGGKLRIITTSYMGATDVKAIEELNKLSNTEIKVSYDTKRTRLHAKTYVFYRNTGFTTAYVGSSNLSNAAISSGFEWNVKVTAKDLPETIAKINATFDSYWNSTEFELYQENKKERLTKALKAEQYHDTNNSSRYMFDINPYSYQKEILDKLKAEREVRSNYKNLVVAATGTGKTVISAFDYKNFSRNHSSEPCRLLFIAHREEILKQSIETFRGVLKDANFGEMFVGGYSKPDDVSHLFMSIQTFNSQEWYKHTSSDYYDYIVVDEFHHAAAPSYQKLLSYYKPKILLGLTATPERMDGRNITDYFDNRIAAEIRLPEAIDRKLLCPFQYFGISDTVDLDGLKWTRGGYDKRELSNVYTLNRAVADKRADNIIRSIIKYVTDVDDVKGLGFCVSVEHAEYMSTYFNEHNIPSMFLTGGSSNEDRNSAKKRLVNGEIKFIFVVDLYNEGVDIPEVNTVLFLRPTESLTVFLQQLGRGLRLSEGKDCLTVLDFIGQANKKYNFEEKFSALLSNSKKSVKQEIKDGFVSAPKGCYIQLEKKAKEYIFKNINASFGSKAGLVTKIQDFVDDSGLKLSLKNFVEYYHLDVKAIYKYSSFSRLCVMAGVKDDFDEELEPIMTKAFQRICYIDSRRWINFIKNFLCNIETIVYDNLNPMDKRMYQMLQFTIWQKDYLSVGFSDELEGFRKLKNCENMYNELVELLNYNFEKIDFIDKPVDLGFDCPLDTYCTYTRDQLLVAMDFMKPNSMREGVKYLPDKKVDIFMVTLNKSDKDYSPSTMYSDYSINEWLFHWQSQSTTTPESTTGQRYIHHKERGNKLLLFVREFKNDKFGTAPYTFLGTVNYVKHEGSRPISFTFKLDSPIPAKYLKKTNKLVIG